MTEQPVDPGSASFGGARINPAHLACPRCRDIGQVQKVTAIISSGTATTWGGGLGLGTAGFGGGLGASKTQTQLIKKLEPPATPVAPVRPEPPQELKPSQQPRIGLLPWIFGFLGALSFVRGLGPMGEAADFFVSLFFLGIAALIYFYRRGRLTDWRRAHARIQAENSKRKREYERALEAWRNGPFARWQEEVAAWEGAMERWNRLFYCIRCDGVFIPGEGGLTPIEQMQQALYSRRNQTRTPLPDGR